MMDSIGHTIGYVLTVLAVAIVLLVLDWKLALVVLIPLPLVSLAAWRYSRRYHERTERLQERWGEAATLVEETVSGIRVVKGLGAGDPLATEFRVRSRTIVDRALDIARLDAVFLPTLEFLPMLGLLAVLWLGGRRVISGDLTLGSFVAFNAYVAMLVWPLRVLGQRVTTLQKAVGASARISEVLNAEPQLREPRHPAKLERPLRGDVRLAGVQFGHDGERPVLDGLREEHHRGTAGASLRPGCWVGAAGRARRARAEDLRCPRRRRARVRRDVSLHGQRAREHPLRAARRE
jgi:ATP-binding cassette subfamily B protein